VTFLDRKVSLKLKKKQATFTAKNCYKAVHCSKPRIIFSSRKILSSNLWR